MKSLSFRAGWCRILLICSVLGFLWAGLGGEQPALAASRVIKLRSASPEQLADVIRQTFHPQVRVAEAAMINAVVVSAESEELLNQVEALVGQLDRVAATLRFSVRMASQEDERHARLRLRSGQVALPEVSRHERSGGETRTVVGMENCKLALTDESTRTEILNGPWGPQPYVIRERRGVSISGFLSSPDEATVSLWYADGESDQAHQLVSQVRAPLGEWVFVGSTDRQEGDRSSGWSVDGKGQVSGGVSRATGLHSYLIKVDRLSGGSDR